MTGCGSERSWEEMRAVQDVHHKHAGGRLLGNITKVTGHSIKSSEENIQHQRTRALHLKIKF